MDQSNPNFTNYTSTYSDDVEWPSEERMRELWEKYVAEHGLPKPFVILAWPVDAGDE